jgi:hypothetical protein
MLMDAVGSADGLIENSSVRSPFTDTDTDTQHPVLGLNSTQ